MNLSEFKDGTPSTKPWLTLVASTLQAVSLTVSNVFTGTIAVIGSITAGGSIQSAGEVNARSLASLLQYNKFAVIPIQGGAVNIALSAGQLVGGVGIINLGAVSGFAAPSSAAIDLELNTGAATPVVDGALIWFDCVNRNTALVTAQMVGPTGVGVTIPIAQAAGRPTTTRFFFQRTAGLWLNVNG